MNTCHRRASAWTGSLLSDGTKWTVSKTSSGAYKLSAKSGGTGKALAVATLNAGQKGGLLQQRRKFDMRVLKKSEFRIFQQFCLVSVCLSLRCLAPGVPLQPMRVILWSRQRLMWIPRPITLREANMKSE